MPFHLGDGGSAPSTYGNTSAETQFKNLKWAAHACNGAGVGHELEWVQQDRSEAMFRLGMQHPDIQLGQPRRHLNVVLLFGFSPELPIPKTYGEFRQMVQRAKALGHNPETGDKIADITVTAGASVVPQLLKNKEYTFPLDIDRRGKTIEPSQRKVVSPLERIAIYSAQPDSGVDMLRAGIEDTPSLLDVQGNHVAKTNNNLLQEAIGIAQSCGAAIVKKPSEVANIFHVAPPHMLKIKASQPEHRR
jgi:hypothetical protein